GRTRPAAADDVRVREQEAVVGEHEAGSGAATQPQAGDVRRHLRRDRGYHPRVRVQRVLVDFHSHLTYSVTAASMVRARRPSCAPLWANGQRLRFLAVPSIPRVISRPSTVAADRRNDLVADEPSTVVTTAPRPLWSGSGARPRGCSGAGAGPDAGAGAGASFAASRSYAESRSTAWPYSACSGDPETAAVIAAASAGAIRDRGARSIVHATGVGAPRSDITVTMASPVPSAVSASSSW